MRNISALEWEWSGNGARMEREGCEGWSRDGAGMEREWNGKGAKDGAGMELGLERPRARPGTRSGAALPFLKWSRTNFLPNTRSSSSKFSNFPHN